MKVRRKNSRVVKKLLEKRGKRKTEPRVELFLSKADGVVPIILSRNRTTFHKPDEYTVRDLKALSKLVFIQKFSRLIQKRTSRTLICPNDCSALSGHSRSHNISLWRHLRLNNTCII